ncbi:MAG: PilZ domain-containing protein [Candidatus Binatia bacterium]
MELLVIPVSIVISSALTWLIAERRGNHGRFNCPHCCKEFVKRVSRKGNGERFASLFYVYPFKCQLCGHRFKRLQWGVRYIKVDKDRRGYDRLSVRFPAWASGDHIDAKATVTDISIGGCTLNSDARLVPGNILSLGLQISNEDLPVIVEAAVVRNVRMNNAGIEFLKLQENDRDQLRIFIRSFLLGRQERVSMGNGISLDRAPSWSRMPREIESR